MRLSIRNKGFLLLYFVTILLSGCFPSEKRNNISIKEVTGNIDSQGIIDEQVDIELTDLISIKGQVNINQAQALNTYQIDYRQFTDVDLSSIDSDLVANGEVYREEASEFFYEKYNLAGVQAEIYPSVLNYTNNYRGEKEWDFLVSTLLLNENIYNLPSFDEAAQDLEHVTVLNAIQQADEIIDKLEVETLATPQVFTIDDAMLTAVNQLDLGAKTDLSLFDEHDQAQMLVYQLALDGIPFGKSVFSMGQEQNFSYNGGKIVFIYTEDGLTWLSMSDVFSKESVRTELLDQISYEDLQNRIINEYDQIIGLESIIVNDIQVVLLPRIQDSDNFVFDLQPYYQISIESKQTSGDKDISSNFYDYYSVSNGERYN